MAEARRGRNGDPGDKTVLTLVNSCGMQHETGLPPIGRRCPYRRAKMAAMGDELQTKSAVESYLLAIREDVAFVLAIDSVNHTNDHTNLFELGMNSMTAIELVARLRDRFGLRIGVTTLLEACTISDLTKLVMTSGQDR